MANFVAMQAGEVFDRVLRGQGLDPATAGLSTTEKACVADHVTEGVEKAWRHAMWPTLMNVKRVTYRAAWSVSTLYAADVEVYTRDTDGTPIYWRCVVGNIGVTPGADAATWTEPTDFMPGIFFADHFVDELDLEAGCFAAHPDRSADPRVYTLKRTHYGACLADRSGTYPAEPYIRYRPMPPKYSWTAYAAQTAYEAGDVCFASNGCWQALVDVTGTTPGTDETKWACVPFPRMFLAYVVAYAVAMRMQDDDGREAALGRAMAELDEIAGVHMAQIRERRRARVRVC